MGDREPPKRRTTDPFSVFLTGGAAVPATTLNPMLPVIGPALALAVQRILIEGSPSTAQAELSRSIDSRSIAALLYLADEAAHRIDEMGAQLEMSEDSARKAVHSLAENGLAEIANPNRAGEAARLTPAGRAMIVQISEIVAPR
jgi:hypothetical protein